MATLKCVITKIRFQEVGKAFAILETTKGVVMGEIAEGLTVGTTLHLHGNYSGQTFYATETIEVIEAPEDTGALWLDWRLPNIGPERSKQLSRRYGADLWQFMDATGTAREGLSSMRGLTPARVDEILAVYSEFPNELRYAMFLGQPNPDRPALGLRLQVFKLAIAEYRDAWGLKDQIEEDPYELYSIPRVTFIALDKLTAGLDMDRDDPRRMRGLAWAIMDYRASQGDTLMLWDDLKRALWEEGRFEQGLDEIKEVLEESRHLTNQNVGLQLREFSVAEERIAGRSLRLIEDEREQLELDLSVLDNQKFKLDDSQRAAVLQLVNAPFAILTGGPGTGKTTVLKQLLLLLSQARGNVVRLASPTGKAAKRMSEVTGMKATTVHRLLEWKPNGFARNHENPIEANVVIVDEASMLDTTVGAALFNAIGSGTRLILVGDVNQLPPVSAGQVLQDLMNSEVVPVIRLTTTHRQGKDSWVIDAAPLVLSGQAPSLVNQSDFAFVPRDSPKEIASSVVAVYRQARAANNENSLQVLTPEHKAGAGTVMLNDTLQRELNPNWVEGDSNTAVLGSKKRIFAGDKVLYTKNEAELGLVNGSIGVVLAASSKGPMPTATVRFLGEVNPKAKKGEDPEVFALSGDQVTPLMLAYAMTVHKAQGSEWSQIVVICEKSHYSMRRRLFYTAITRTSKNLVIIGDAASVRRAARRNDDENRKTFLVQQLREEKE